MALIKQPPFGLRIGPEDPEERVPKSQPCGGALPLRRIPGSVDGNLTQVHRGLMLVLQTDRKTMSDRELSDPITMRLPIDVLSEIEEIAAICDRTRSWVFVRALKSYLAAEGREIIEIAKARRD